MIVLLAFFGYQTPNIPRLAKGAAREKLLDSLLGLVLGGVNGYLIVGSIWHYLHVANYPFNFIIHPTQVPPQFAETTARTLQLISALPQTWLTAPGVYFAVAIGFTFIVIVFI